ncbi:hypothetical protein [Siphonobacter curvatus]|uniref:SIMPL domain-containing protein n=1 Tax=Siphonobacter curvatus TaxID=2094562 RepID=A0A2S7IRF0_9BACT|nr:hypothetical protein [Siphonobacter curvatus]PQA60218.1 hypothetical protein C5O19_11550 [Siphonobacter curvatus]
MTIDSFSLTLTERVAATPKEILFSTALDFKSLPEAQQNIASAHEQWTAFLSDSQIAYEDLGIVEFHNNEIDYETPFCQIRLTPETYALVETYRTSHPELALAQISSTFEEQDKLEVKNRILAKAQEQATSWAKQANLQLKPGFQIQLVEPEPIAGDWIIGPPLSAKVNHFNSWIKLTYQVTFHVEPRFFAPEDMTVDYISLD